MLHSDNSYACLRDNNSECIFLLRKQPNTRTHARTHARTYTYAHTRTHTYTHAHTHIRTQTYTNTHNDFTHTHFCYRYTYLAFSKLYSFVKSSFRQNVYRENKTHILSGYRYWNMNKNVKDC